MLFLAFSQGCPSAVCYLISCVKCKAGSRGFLFLFTSDVGFCKPFLCHLHIFSLRINWIHSRHGKVLYIND